MAQALFEEGRALMEASNFTLACRKLAESHRLDPGGGTLLNLGTCYEKAGRIASAWATYEEAYRLARREGRADREQFTKEKLDELEPRVSHVVIAVPEAAHAEGMEVTLGERSLTSAAWGSPLPLDTGEYALRVTAPGRKPWTQQVTVERDGTTTRIEVPMLVEEGPTPAPTPVAAQPGSGKPEAPAPAPTPPAPVAHESTTPVLGYVIGGVGLASLAVGGYFGTKAVSTWSDRNDACDGNECSPRGMTLGTETNRYANYANVGIGAGVLGVGIGMVLILSNGSPGSPRADGGVAVTPVLSPLGLGASGKW